MFLDLEGLDGINDEDKRDEKIRSILDVLDPDNPPFLSALLAHKDENSAQHTFLILASGQYAFEWRIKALRDEWGNPVNPGDDVTRCMPINRVKMDGDLVTPTVLSKAKKDGSFERKYEKVKKFRVDKYGCFQCGFDDAVYFLNNWGYNLKTRSAVTDKPEYSYEPVDMRDPTKGQKKHIHYRRYAEIDREDYALLNSRAQKQK